MTTEAPGPRLWEELLRETERVGFPVMLKSTAGGGGIGMQLCRDAADLDRAYAAVERLAQNNFSDGGLFPEKFIERARHIEVQLFGDGAGRVVALGERDRSTQRRNQKVIEETPAPGLHLVGPSGTPQAAAGRMHRWSRSAARCHFRGRSRR